MMLTLGLRWLVASLEQPVSIGHLFLMAQAENPMRAQTKTARVLSLLLYMQGTIVGYALMKQIHLGTVFSLPTFPVRVRPKCSMLHVGAVLIRLGA